MSHLHRVSIFCFRRLQGDLQYLFVRRRPFLEFDWAPIHASILPQDTLPQAAVRNMREQWGAPMPSPWIDLETFDRHPVGDSELIDWCVGYGVTGAWVPKVPEDGLSALKWTNLPAGFRLLQEEENRRALFRLHLAAH